MKIKTSELSGAALDWAVAQATGEEIHHEYVDSEQRKMLLSKWQDYSRNGDFSQQEEWAPSTDWSQCGPLIERFLVTVSGSDAEADEGQDWRWGAAINDHPNCPADNWEQGPTALIAACRAIVAAKLGDEVDVPEGLV